ncbi:MAG: universal stress protein [Bacteroidia bacterium]|nr:universal stress protein [Bacteroidia bacterium]
MKLEKKAIFIPWDFTSSCEYAFQHAMNFTGLLESEIVLVHIIGNPKQEKETQNKLDAEAKNLYNKYKVEPKTLVRVGKLYSTITDISKEFETSLYVMKTDGVKGMQKYFGSRAIKIIFETQVPFIVVQAPPKKKEYNSIVFPIDYSFESKEKLHWVKWLSRIFKTQVQIITPDIVDSGHRQKIKNNVIFTKNILNDELIDYEIIVGAGKGEFANAVMNFANKSDSDLIIVMVPKDVGFQEFLSGSKAQRIIANPYKVPVFAINPRNIRRLGGFGG